MAPNELKALDRWVLWRFVDGHRKVPFTVHGHKASSTNPDHWASYDAAVAAYSDAPDGWAGLGFVFANDGICGVDLDNCRNPETGQIAPWAQEIIDEADTYTEVSPSGKGVKLFCLGDIPESYNRKNEDGSGIESYSWGRFFTMTGEGECKPLKQVPERLRIAPKSDKKLSAADREQEYKDLCEYVMNTMPASEEGQNGSGALIAVGHEIVRHGFVGSLGFDLFEKFATERSDPPWEPEGAQGYKRKWTEVLKRAEIEGDVGSSITPANDFAALPVVDGQEPLPRIMTAADLATRVKPTDYLVEGVMARGQHMIVSGPKKALKTSIMTDLAVSLATNTAFLGTFDVLSRRRVLVVSGESGPAALQSIQNRVIAARGLTVADLDDLFWSVDLPQTANDKQMSQLERDLRMHEIGVVMLDPAYLMIPGADAGNVMIMGERLRKLGDLCNRCGTTMILAHHVKKTADGTDLNDMAWAGFAEFARQWLIIKRNGKYALGHSDLKLSIGGSAGHSGEYRVIVDEGVRDDIVDERTWKVKVSDYAEDDAIREANDEHLKDLMVEFLHERRAAIQQDFVDRLSKYSGSTVHKDRVKRLLNELLDDGTFLESNNPGDGMRRGRSFKAYCLNQDHLEDAA